jgi:antitoxin (DNA-binding transcriptional repressor) of toxin-antitoxin stability system
VVVPPSKIKGMRQPDPERQDADSTVLELGLADIIAAVQAGGAVPLSKDGEVVAVVVSPEIAEAGQRALEQR